MNRDALVLSLFPGADLFGRGFEAEGFSVVRGPDEIWGGDVRSFHVPAGAFAGVIGGPPCQQFSGANRAPNPAEGEAMLREFERVVSEAAPEWWLAENVVGVPDIDVPGYEVQRFNLNAKECGGRQNRPRRFQFGTRDGSRLLVDRSVTSGDVEPCCLASEGKSVQRRTWADFCELQGLPRDFDMPGLSVEAKYRAIGNGVPVFMARRLARAVLFRHYYRGTRFCPCQCGRRLTGRQKLATPACRQRWSRSRRGAGNRDAAGVTAPGSVTSGPSQLP